MIVASYCQDDLIKTLWPSCLPFNTIYDHTLAWRSNQGNGQQKYSTIIDVPGAEHQLEVQSKGMMCHPVDVTKRL